jgi:hypothetical protein
VARVDRPHVALEGDPDRVVELRRDLVGAAKVHARAERDRREVDAASGNAVDDLVQRAVATNRDDELRASLDGFACEVDQVAGALREERVTL